jgi:hypothetical protein
MYVPALSAGPLPDFLPAPDPCLLTSVRGM